MARYNTVATSSSTSTTTTVGTPNAGLFTKLTGSTTYTVTVPDPVLFPGSTQIYYNANSVAVTLSTPNGNFTGPGVTTATTISVAPTQTVYVVSDGANWVVSFTTGGPLLATTGTFTGALAVNASGGITTTQSGTVPILNTNATGLNIGGAATTVAIGAATGTATVNNATVTLSNATALNINGASPSIVTSSTGTASVFNTNALTGQLFQAATSVSIGATTGTTSIRNTTVNIANASGVLQINGTQVLSASTLGSGVTASSLTSVGTLTGLTTGGKVSVTFAGGADLTNSTAMLEIQDNGTTSRPAISFHRPGVYASKITFHTDNAYYFGGWSAGAGASPIVCGGVNPGATNSYDLGTTALRWRNIYTQDLHLSNGIGDYTMVEGEENLYLVNNKNKKSYKFALIEVPADEVPPKSAT